MTNPECALIPLEPWQCALYEALSKPFTLRDALGWVASVGSHRSQLKNDGDVTAADGAATQLRIALVKLAAVEAANHRALGRKATALGRHRAFWANDSLTAAMVTAAIAADVAALTQGPHDQARIDRLLQGTAR